MVNAPARDAACAKPFPGTRERAMQFRRYFTRPLMPRSTQAVAVRPSAVVDLALVLAPAAVTPVAHAPGSPMQDAADSPMPAPRKFPFHKVHHHRPGAPAPPIPARRPGLLALLINALALTALAAAAYNRIDQANSSENCLRSDNSSNKLKATSAEPS